MLFSFCGRVLASHYQMIDSPARALLALKSLNTTKIMKLKKLLKDLQVKEIKGSKEIEITGLCAHSKFVAPGNLFIAKKGKVEDGTMFIREAVDAGAVAVLTDMYDPSQKHVTQIIHPHVASIEAQLAAHYYQFASQQLYTVGITGTNGKTTSSFLIKHLLDQLNLSAGLIGTIEYVMGPVRYQATRTTPDVISNHKMLREMVLQGCKSAVLEVTSHALDQQRVAGIDFDVAIFTNLTLDHLDYHHTMDQYCLAKQKLFLSLNTAKKNGKNPLAILNADDPWSEKIYQGCECPKLTYAIDQKADLKASQICLSPKGTSFIISYQNKNYPCSLNLIGRFNVYNALAALAVGIAKKHPLEKLIPLLENFTSVQGRLEYVPNTLDLTIYVDFAHTDDALANVLQTLRELKKGRLITVFGCGGDRDHSKRAKMARVSEQLSDITIVTSDNPRHEDPAAICREITEGFKDNGHYYVEIDRRSAIQKAIQLADKDDIILIAGKGHETYQIFAHTTIEFDDRKVAEELCLIRSASTANCTP